MERRHLEIFTSTSSTETESAASEGAPRIDRRSAMSALVAGAALVQTACGTTSPSFGSDAGTTTSPDDSGTSTSSCDTAPAGVDAGDVSGFPVGSWKMAGSSRDPFVVAQDSGGLFAYSAICTHEGCKIGTPNATTGASTCPCHGAKFDGNGAVTKGPARTNLSHYAVALCGGHVYVDTATTVDATTRTPAS